ncbi:MAG: ATP-grasp domain-containing protein, partial [Gemmatimonadales bacterium]
MSASVMGLSGSPDMIAIYYEHPHWFAPLFAELDRRATGYTRLHAAHHRFDPGGPPSYALVFNRMSPSAWQRGLGHAVFYTHHFLAHLERHGVRVVNGTRAFRAETSKALQLSVLRSLGLPHPATRVIHDAADAPAAAAELRFPVVLKPNIGGSGAGVRRFGEPADLAIAAAAGELELGPDHTALVQEFIPAEAERITRVEVLGGRYLYAIRVYSSGDTFNLCPADVCQTTQGAELVRSACPVDAPRNGLRVEGYDAPPDVARAVERIAAACGIEVGGIEYV